MEQAHEQLNAQMWGAEAGPSDGQLSLSVWRDAPTRKKAACAAASRPCSARHMGLLPHATPRMDAGILGTPARAPPGPATTAAAPQR